MRSYTVNTQPVTVSVNGIEFKMLKSDALAQAEIVDYLANAAALKIEKPADVETVLRAGCNLIDSLLGAGACYSIWNDTPISLGHIIALLTQICADCVRFYHAYLKNEYLED